MAYPVVCKRTAQGNVIASIPALPGTISYGPDEASAIRNVEKALTAMLSSLIEDRKEIPMPPRRKKGQSVVVAAPLIAAKVALYRAMRERGMTQLDLARRLGCDPRQVRRLLDPAQRSRLDLLESALAGVGKQLVLDVVDRDAA